MSSAHRAGTEGESASFNGAANDEEDDDDDDIINVDDFGDHPLPKSDVPMISGMARNEWDSLALHVKTSIFKLTKEIGAVFADASEIKGEIGEEVSPSISLSMRFALLFLRL